MKNNETERYIKSCQTDFWQEIFHIEAEYISRHISGCREILSIGCGPAHIERTLAGKGFNITGLDISRDALATAPDSIRKTVARAEDMPFPESSFDAALYVASLQFVDDYKEAVKKTARCVRENGIIIVMLLNPDSSFFKKRNSDPDSYISSTKHKNLVEIEDVIKEYFSVSSEYFIGVRESDVFESSDPEEAVLYVIKGTKKTLEKNRNKDSLKNERQAEI